MHSSVVAAVVGIYLGCTVARRADRPELGRVTQLSLVRWMRYIIGFPDALVFFGEASPITTCYSTIKVWRLALDDSKFRSIPVCRFSSSELSMIPFCSIYKPQKRHFDTIKNIVTTTIWLRLLVAGGYYCPIFVSILSANHMSRWSREDRQELQQDGPYLWYR